MTKSRYHTRIVRDERGKKVGQWWIVIHYRKPPIYRWLRSIQSNESSFDYLKRLYLPPIAIIRYVGIDWRHRGQGWGNVAMQQMVEYCSDRDCRYIILEADADRRQVKGMDLEKWYCNRGFQQIGDAWGGIHLVMLRGLQKVSQRAA